LHCLGGIFDWDKSVARLAALNKQAEDPDLWQNPEKAQSLMRQRTQLDDALTNGRALQDELANNIELIDLGEAENDTDIIEESEAALIDMLAKAAQMKTETLLAGAADTNDSFLEIDAGPGGTERQV